MNSQLLTILNNPIIEGFFTASMRLSIPILLAAIGGIYNERAGLSNIGMEGIMLFGSLVGFMVSHATGNIWLGILAAILTGIILGLLMGFFEINLMVNQVVFGIALNLSGLGATSFIYRIAYGIGQSPRINPLPSLAIPYLSKIPVLGPLFFNQTIVAYLTYLIVLLTAIIFTKTSLGLGIIASGENPEAAETKGIDVIKTRYTVIVISGALCALGGAFLSTNSTGIFVSNMTAGRGYIALAILVIGRWNPFGVFAAALLFGAADALQLRTQLLNVSIPYQFLVMLPYLLCIIVMMLFSKSSSAPAALGETYQRDKN